MRQSLRLATIPALILLALCSARATAADEQGKRDLAAMQGQWVCQEATMAGEVAPADGLKTLSFTIKDDKIISSADPADAATLKLDASKAPATADFTDKDGKVDRGIYQIEGGTLKLCMSLAESGKDRPATFSSTKENGYMLLVLKRAATKD